MNRAFLLSVVSLVALGCSSSGDLGAGTTGEGGASASTSVGSPTGTSTSGITTTTTGDPTGSTGSTGSGGSTGAGGAGGSLGSGPPAFQKSCVSCHGPDASGTASGPAIRHANPALVAYFVRNGEDNVFIDQGTTPTDQTGLVGDDRKMTPFTAAEVSDNDITDITTWLDSLPRPADGGGLFLESCSYCHGPNMPNNSASATHPRGANYVKPKVSAVGKTWSEFASTVRSGVNPALDPVSRRRYMPAFPDTLITGAELSAIAHWICGQYPGQGVTIPAGSYCNSIP